MKYNPFYLKSKDTNLSPAHPEPEHGFPYDYIPSTEMVALNHNLPNALQTNPTNIEIEINQMKPLKEELNENFKRASESTQTQTQGRDSVLGNFSEHEEEKEIDIFKVFDYPLNPYKQRLDDFLRSWWFQMIVGAFTIWALFADDFRMIFVPKDPGDAVFNAINIICMFIFLVELVIASITRSKYFGSFFFFMDLISTFIIVFDLSWVQEDLMSSQNTLSKQKINLSASLKVMRIIRLIRLIRLIKLYKAYQEKKKIESFKEIMEISQKIQTFSQRRKKSISLEMQYEKDKSEKLKEEREKLLLKETKIGNQLLEITIKRTIFLLLILVFCGPLFNSGFYYSPEKSYINDLNVLMNFSDSNIDKETMNMFFRDYINKETQSEFPLVYCEVPPINALYISKDYNSLRSQEKETYTVISANSSMVFVSEISLRPQIKWDSLINILQTVYVGIILLVTCLLFNKDLNNYVIQPLKRMFININKIANNPLASKEEFSFSHDLKIYETELIEESITKIGVLLALGFGEAGSFIISQNISQEGDLVATMPGKKTFAVFGFCDIRNFTDATEVLQEEVMVFVNTIASVVHSTVDRYTGAANKNIGDAFLLVWKLPKSEISIENGQVLLKKGRLAKNTVDLSLISFLKIIVALHSSPELLKYRENPKLNVRLPNYRIKMGFGLHLGWAIEGSIGSEFKIDASYLSPNVNLAARLEAATKQYGVALLISNDFIEYSSKKTRKLCREIDRVTVKGSLKPIGLYTVDYDPSDLSIKKNDGVCTNKKTIIIEARNFKRQSMNINEKMNYLYEKEEDLKKMLQSCLGPFKENFEKGFKYYIGGKWQDAKESIEYALKFKGNDIPSHVLIEVMSESGFKVPSNWKGYRALTEK